MDAAGESLGYSDSLVNDDDDDDGDDDDDDDYDDQDLRS